MTKKDRSPEPVEVLPQQSTSTRIQGADHVTEIPETVVVVDGNTYYVSFDLFPSPSLSLPLVMYTLCLFNEMSQN